MSISSFWYLSNFKNRIFVQTSKILNALMLYICYCSFVWSFSFMDVVSCHLNWNILIRVAVTLCNCTWKFKPKRKPGICKLKIIQHLKKKISNTYLGPVRFYNIRGGFLNNFFCLVKSGHGRYKFSAKFLFGGFFLVVSQRIYIICQLVPKNRVFFKSF